VLSDFRAIGLICPRQRQAYANTVYLYIAFIYNNTSILILLFTHARIIFLLFLLGQVAVVLHYVKIMFQSLAMT
jgi:hypothetical protein